LLLIVLKYVVVMAAVLVVVAFAVAQKVGMVVVMKIT
jgi:hypothetical protein